jgi:hypothetical protein
MAKIHPPGKPRVPTPGLPVAHDLRERQRLAAEEALKRGVTPLEVRLEVMDYHRERYLVALAQASSQKSHERVARAAAQLRDAACAAAPYMHPRLAAAIVKNESTDPFADFLRELDGKSRGLPNGHALIDVSPRAGDD